MEARTILVIEDEPVQRALLRRILEDAGYEVLAAGDGMAARDIYCREGRRIDLVLSDMALPMFGGWTVYTMLKEINPDVKMILTSGYLDDRVKNDLVKGGVMDFIPKPYLPETVLGSVKQALTA